MNERADRAEGYITRVQELESLNTTQADELNTLRQEIVSLNELLDNCAVVNQELQRQIALLTEQVDIEVRLRQQDFDRTVEP